MSIYNSREIHNVEIKLYQQLKRYLTACGNGHGSYGIVENAINNSLVPRIEDMLVEDAMNGGSHELKKKQIQDNTIIFGSTGVFANYHLGDGAFYNILKKNGEIPFHDTKSLIEEGNRLLDMINDLDKGMTYTAFNHKYHRPPKYNGLDKLILASEKMLNNIIENHNFNDMDIVTSVFPYYTGDNGGLYVSMFPDERMATYSLYQFMSNNTQELGLPVPTLKNDKLFLGENEVLRSKIAFTFKLSDAEHNQRQFYLEEISVDFSTELPQKISLVDQKGNVMPIVGDFGEIGGKGISLDFDLSRADTKKWATRVVNDIIFQQNHPEPELMLEIDKITVGEAFKKICRDYELERSSEGVER